LILSREPSLATSSTPADKGSMKAQSNLIQRFASEIPAKFGLDKKSIRDKHPFLHHQFYPKMYI
jgi:hypothetical protein